MLQPRDADYMKNDVCCPHVICSARVICSAPGTLMLMGEHAVLYQRSALTAAIDQRVRVSITLRDDDYIEISSSTLGNFKTHLSDLQPCKPFEFVTTALTHSKMKKGLTCQIESQCSHQMGLGTSAAVTVASVAALAKIMGETIDLYTVFKRALAVIRQVQGQGSGADVAASTYGGVVKYTCKDIPSIEKLKNIPSLACVFSGYKMATKEVIALVKSRYEQDKTTYEAIFTAIDDLVLKAAIAIEQEDLPLLGILFNRQQTLMQALEVSDSHLDFLIATLRAQKGILGAKISGSGLGDCVIGLWDPKEKSPLPLENEIKVEISPQGLLYE